MTRKPHKQTFIRTFITLPHIKPTQMTVADASSTPTQSLLRWAMMLASDHQMRHIGTEHLSFEGKQNMVDIRNVTEHFSVAPQIQIDDLEAIKAAGFKTIICNRPDHESGPEQPGIESMQAAAEGLGFVFLALPFSGMPAPEIASQQGTLIAASAAPVLAYCRSGTRSITAWALSQSGQGRADVIIKEAAEAGYDLTGLQDHL